MKMLKRTITLLLLLSLVMSLMACAKDPATAEESKEEPATTVEEKKEVEEEIELVDESLVMSDEEIKEAAKEKKPIIVEYFKDQGADQEIKTSIEFKKTVDGVEYKGILYLDKSKEKYNSGSDKYELYYRGEMNPAE